MSDGIIKIEELRVCFDRETSIKDSLQNKASYFLGIISIVITIMCTYLSNHVPIVNLNSTCNMILIILLCVSFLCSLLSCLLMFVPTNYALPFSFRSYKVF